MKYLDQLLELRAVEPNSSWPVLMSKIDLVSILSIYHPQSADKFKEEYGEAVMLVYNAFTHKNFHISISLKVAEYNFSPLLSDYSAKSHVSFVLF